MKVLMPVDGSESTQRMLAYMAAHGELLGPSHDYLVFTAVTPMPSHVARFITHDVIEQHHREEAEAVLQPVRDFFAQQGWKAQFVHAAGHAGEAIARQCEKSSPDLIVMGSHGHSALGNMVLGSVATNVLARCKVPVLLVR